MILLRNHLPYPEQLRVLHLFEGVVGCSGHVVVDEYLGPLLLGLAGEDLNQLVSQLQVAGGAVYVAGGPIAAGSQVRPPDDLTEVHPGMLLDGLDQHEAAVFGLVVAVLAEGSRGPASRPFRRGVQGISPATGT